MALNHELLLPNTFQHYLLGLFAVANNFPAIGPFLSLSQGLPKRQVRRVIALASVSSLLIMLGSYVLGTAVLQFFGIGVSAFQIAGGLLLGQAGSACSAPGIRAIRTRRVAISAAWTWGR